LIVLRLGLLLLCALIARRLPSAGYGRLRPWLLGAAAGAAALLTISLQSHSAALPGSQALLATALDWLHLLAMAVWLGGLPALVWLLWPGRAQRGLASVLVPRFSIVALPCVAILALTGLYSAWAHVLTIEALTTTTHGRALSLKLGLFAVLLVVGAANLLLISPLLRRDETRAARWLRRTVRLEMVVGAAVLLLVGVMTAVGPAFEALEAQQRLGFRESARMEAVEMVLRVTPLRPGDNEFAVDVSDDRPGAVGVEPLVLLRFSNEDENMGVQQVETQPADAGRFLARGAYLSAVGNWQVEVILRRAGFDDVRHAFDLSVEPEVE
jgi:copper transport protein